MTRIVRAFHGTTYDAARSILSGLSPFRPSANAHDWLGHGIYFFEESEAFAVDWALGKVRDFASQGLITSPAVIAADIDLSDCLDLCSADYSSNLGRIYSTLSRPVRVQHAPLLETSRPTQMLVGDIQMPPTTWTMNYTDTTVLGALVHDLKTNGTPITSKRSAFVDGRQLYPNSYFFHRTQVQIAVLDAVIITRPELIFPVAVTSAATNLTASTP